MATQQNVRPEGYGALPRRFRAYIEGLESTIATLNTQVPSRRLMKGATVKIMDLLHHGNDGFLPDNTRVLFSPIATRASGNEIRVSMTERGIEVYGQPDPLIIRPSVSNVLVIESARLWPS